MKVLLINGSPHAHGCTYTALCEIAETLRQEQVECEIFHIGQEPIRGCTGCGKCRATGRCIFTNDSVNTVIEKAEQCDGFIFGSPVHFAAASGAMTSLMDRVFSAGGAAFAYKPGACALSARRAGTTAAYDQLNKYIGISNMIMVPAQYWNMVHGTTPEEVLQDKEGLQIMRGIGRSMAWLLRLIECGKAQGIALPQREEARQRTNFIGQK